MRPAVVAASEAIAAEAAAQSPTKLPRVLHESAFRVAIAAEYDRVHKQAPVDEWFGGDGTISATYSSRGY